MRAAAAWCRRCAIGVGGGWRPREGGRPQERQGGRHRVREEVVDGGEDAGGEPAGAGPALDGVVDDALDIEVRDGRQDGLDCLLDGVMRQRAQVANRGRGPGRVRPGVRSKELVAFGGLARGRGSRRVEDGGDEADVLEHGRPDYLLARRRRRVGKGPAAQCGTPQHGGAGALGRATSSVRDVLWGGVGGRLVAARRRVGEAWGWELAGWRLRRTSMCDRRTSLMANLDQLSPPALILAADSRTSDGFRCIVGYVRERNTHTRPMVGK